MYVTAELFAHLFAISNRGSQLVERHGVPRLSIVERLKPEITCSRTTKYSAMCTPRVRSQLTAAYMSSVTMSSAASAMSST